MAKKLNELQKSINSDLVNNGLKAYTELQYRTNKDAMTLLSMKDGSYISNQKEPAEGDLKDKLHYISDKSQEYNNYISSLANTIAYNILEVQKWVSNIFQIEHQPLIEKIACRAYLGEMNSSYTCNECGAMIENKTKYVKSISDWIQFCNVVDHLNEFIKVAQPNWDKLAKKEKQEYINTLMILAQTRFMSQNNLPLNIVIYFLQNYQLNQVILAKAEWLLKYQLPNISDIETAKEVVHFTKLNKIS